jgi:hypothetical protein
MVQINTPQGPRMIPEDQLAELQRQQLAELQKQQQQAVAVNLPSVGFVPPGAEVSTKLKAVEDKAPVGEKKPAPQEDKRQEEPAKEESEHLRALREGKAVNTSKRAKDAGMNLLDQKKARQGIRKLVDKLKKSDTNEWEDLVGVAIMQTPEIFTYLNAVTIYAALAEIQADVEFAERIVNALKSSSMIPDGVLVFTEADLAQREVNEIVKETLDADNEETDA